MAAIVSVKSKCGRITCVRASTIRRYTVVMTITLVNATIKDNPATPVSSVIWINGHLSCSATPRQFQPNPEKTQPRNHSSVVHAAARMKASRRLLVDFVHGDCGGGDVLRACASIWPHLLAARDCAFRARGRTRWQSHAQIAK